MAAKLSIVCVIGLLVETISSQYIGPNIPIGPGCGCQNAFPVGPIGPVSGLCGPVSGLCGPVSGYLTIANTPEPTVSLCSNDLLISGPVVVAGRLPFAGTVALEGALPAAGAGAVNYGCGNAIGIVTEGPIATGIVGNNYGGFVY